MQFNVRITLPEAPEVNLAEKIAIEGFFANVRTPIHPETEMDALKNDLTEHLVSEGIISAERRADLQFEFG
ncbi:hypothetical protein [Sedimentimonas flavescens]|uniref:hypothetical protein n=1 Tax=Sedimentimonas flavescens TaxID=2851012 RepID=UPI001C49EF81|nr:hypothetical protein [Sedimentimonas flavescens]MBW0159586.1 hypothetical protein [Sedimentimonas flavescens]